MLGRLTAVTISTPDLDRSVEVWMDAFGYLPLERSTVDEALAAAWGARAAAGSRTALIQPQGGSNCPVRFVEGPAVPDYEPMKSHGWASFEFICKDIYDLAEKIANKPFEIVGPPQVLQFDFTDKISAFQAIGPAGEMIYMTHVEGPVPGFDLPRAEAEVDRCFVAILGGPDMDAMRRYYATAFGRESPEPFTTRVTVLARPHGLDPETKFQLSTLALEDATLIEIDGFPETATDRPTAPGHLPPGNAMVSFEIASLDGLSVDFFTPPKVREEAPYDGRRMAVTIGAAGELIELIETGG